MTYQAELKQKQQKWKSIIDSFHSSGLSRTEFCQKNSISPHVFYYWLDKFSKKSVKASTGVQPAPAVKVVVDKPKVHKNQLPDPKWLAQFLIALNEAN
jgi:hypothetical protein